jgi:hypothetical protein
VAAKSPRCGSAYFGVGAVQRAGKVGSRWALGAYRPYESDAFDVAGQTVGTDQQFMTFDKAQDPTETNGAAMGWMILRLSLEAVIGKESGLGIYPIDGAPPRFRASVCKATHGRSV